MSISFYNLSKANLALLEAIGSKKTVLENELLIKRGAEPTAFFFILSGLLSIQISNDSYEHNIIIYPGEVLGEMGLIEKQVSSVDVLAVETSEILSIPYKNLEDLLHRDPEFSKHFYVALLLSLSQRLRNLTNEFIDKFTLTAEEPREKSARFCQLRGPVDFFNSDLDPDFKKIAAIISSLEPIENILNYLVEEPQKAKCLFEKRESLLNVATISWESINLLFQTLNKLGITQLHTKIKHHLGSFTAREKELMLQDIAVQKTLTLQFHQMRGMLTGIGNFKINKEILRKISTQLQLPAKAIKECAINPFDLPPEIHFRLLRGIVSCFFTPGIWTHLSFLAILLPTDNLEKYFSISLSPNESLVLSTKNFCDIVMQYVKQAFPYLPIILIEP